MAECMDECLIGHAINEGFDYVGVGDVREPIALLGEALNVLQEGHIGPLPTVAEVLGLSKVGVGTLEVADEDRMEIAPAADAVGLELLEPSSGRA